MLGFDIQRAAGSAIGRADLFPCLRILIGGKHVEECFSSEGRTQTSVMKRKFRITRRGTECLIRQEPEIASLIPEVI